MLEFGIALGLGSAAAWGIGDMAGGVAARRARPMAVTAAAQAVGLALLLGLALAVRPPAPQLSTVLLGAAGGLLGGAGLAALYAGLAAGSMGIVSTLSGLGAVMVPLSVGFAFQGAQVGPFRLLGVACAVTAAIAASGVTRQAASRRSLLFAAVSGLGFGGWFVFIDLAAADSPLWALVAGRAAATALIGAAALIASARSHEPSGLRRVVPLLILAGITDVSANALVVASFSSVITGVAAALSGLYPLMTMLLARLFLGERLPRLGLAAVGLAVTGISLISIGG